jgi:GntR family transcriptional regulator/MocR family aminotransferase
LDGGVLDLHLELDRAGGLLHSLEHALRDAVRSGRLAPGTRLPGTRSLAADLGLSRGTVVQAFAQLVAEGWLVAVPGSGTVVSDVAAPRSELPEPPRPAAASSSTIDLRPGRPDLSAFPRSAWASAVRRALAATATTLDYGDPAGRPELRTAVAGHVARTRGVRATAGSVVVTAGFTAALALLGRALHGQGMRAAATEDPGFAPHRRLLRAAGLRTRPLTVDDDGADPADLPATAALALLTPAHQHPYGVVLAPARRAAFVQWARRHEGVLVEDDYDGEFRYDRQPVGAMQPLDPDRVVYAGSASKSLAPGLRLGWLVVPPALRAPLLEAVEDTGAMVPVVDQLALAHLIDSGEYDRHIRRMRLVYRRRRAELADRVAAVGGSLTGVAAGLHALLPVGSAGEERDLVAAAARTGLQVHGLHIARYWHRPGREQAAALVLGYATPPGHAWRPALDVLTDVLAATGR